MVVSLGDVSQDEGLEDLPEEPYRPTMSSSHIDRRGFLTASAASLASVGIAPAAAAAPRRAGSRSPKKGFATVTKKDNLSWRKRVKALNARWFYSWGLNQPVGVPRNVEFIPMIWGAWGNSIDKHTANLAERIKRDEISHVLAFNEPDQHDQSNLTVERVLELWPRLMELGVPLVSPGCVHPDREWMTQFMKEADKRNYRVDAVAVHSYGGASAEALMNRLEKVYKTYGRPLWITEFAVGDWRAKSLEQNKFPPETVARFMRAVLPALDAANFVQRYAWFSASQTSKALGTSALFDKRGRLTELGKIYREA